MDWVRTGAVSAVVVGAALLTAPSAAGAVAVEASCAKGDVCVWSGKAGQGTRCHWRGNDPDWRGGAVRCGIKVRSIWNNGRTNDPYNKVRFYRQKDYQSQISDPVPVTAKPITAGGLTIRSHRWTR
ncbi:MULTISPECIES: peptidase inhibitor family I36 protein [Thermomonosporaceae]|uniref:peptidase inhibitor family I36 protein n=1 Tax=Thermomonosporaceae TaxID=2012 RepID=UPI00255B29AF|nr:MULTISPECIES: peptidase inhibitor family I36 protein [Thermomonosporaceae]MDL4773975.1 peptidase inhibitor family I36 protein [Actinomadura xylanilytica]